ncbi:hypothetical protein [Paraburkholderia tropica]|uniref:hypothetical protein n=1 Tax=Paraburkholderia tropica TaxID=92647 RepID=UPI002ABDA036|nr:hypothetical protein [Paraburkholderia tropica]
MARGEPVTPCNRSSSNASQSSTSNNYADKRNAVQNGIGVSGDGNNTSYSSYAVTADPTIATAAIGGAVASASAAINGNSAVAANANSSMADVSKSVVAASSHLADVGLSMLQTNTALANSLEGGVNQAMQATTGIAQQLAQTQIAAQNDNRYLIAAGLAVVAIVGVAAFSKKVA